jgi:hypothetical protein
MVGVLCACFISTFDDSISSYEDLGVSSVWSIVSSYKTSILCFVTIWASTVYQNSQKLDTKSSKTYRKYIEREQGVVEERGWLFTYAESWLKATTYLGNSFIKPDETNGSNTNAKSSSMVSFGDSLKVGLVCKACKSKSKEKDMDGKAEILSNCCDEGGKKWTVRLPDILEDHNLHVDLKKNWHFLEDVMNILVDHKNRIDEQCSEDTVILSPEEFSVFIESIESATLDEEIMELLWEPKILHKVLTRYNESSHVPKIVPVSMQREELSLYCTPKEAVTLISECEEGIDIDSIQRGLSFNKRSRKVYNHYLAKDHDGRDIFLKIKGTQAKIKVKKERLEQRVSIETWEEIKSVDLQGTYEFKATGADKESLEAIKQFCNTGRVSCELLANQIAAEGSGLQNAAGALGMSSLEDMCKYYLTFSTFVISSRESGHVG